MNYTLRELMVAAAAREIRDGDKVFVGMRLPLLGFAVAKETHAPSAIGIFENGVIRDWPALESIFTMSDPPNIAGALACAGLNDVMFLLQTGRVELGFIGGALLMWLLVTVAWPAHLEEEVEDEEHREVKH